jgi:hypothetical protein
MREASERVPLQIEEASSLRVEIRHQIGSIVYVLDTPAEIEETVAFGFKLMDQQYEHMTSEPDLDMPEFEKGRRDYWIERGHNFKPLGDGNFELHITAEEWGRTKQ